MSFASIGIERTERADMVYVEVETDGGIVGHGISFITQARPVAEAINAVLGPAIMGGDALAHERQWRVMYCSATPWAQSGYASHAISAVDLALWDIKGQTLGLPGWWLIGGARDRVPAFATCCFSFLDDADLAQVALRIVAQGFKMQVGRPGLDQRSDARPLDAIVRRDAERVRVCAWRLARGEIDIDAGCRLDLPRRC